MVAKDTIKIMAIQGLGMALSFASHALMARFFGAEEYGIYVYCLTWVTVVVALSRAGASSAIVKFTSIYFSKRNDSKLSALVKYFTYRILLVSLLMSLAILLLSMVFIDDRVSPYLPDLHVALIIVPILALTVVRQSFLRGIGKVSISNLLDQVIRPGLFLFLFLMLFWTNFVTNDALHALILNAFVSAFIAILGAVIARRWFPLSGAHFELNSKQKKEWKTTAGIMTVGTASNLLLKNADLILIGVLLDPTSTAHYAVASRLANLAAYPLNAVNVVVQPLFARLYAHSDIDSMQKIMTWAVRFLFFFSIIIWLLVYFAGKFALGLFGDSFIASYTSMIILVAGIAARSFVGPVGNLLNMTGQHKAVAKFMLFGAFFNIVMNLLLIPDFGIVGAAISTATVQLIFPIHASRIVTRKIGVKPYLWSRV